MRGLYLVTPNWDDTDRLLDVSEQALQAGVALLQYRHKSADAEQRREQAGALLTLARKYGVPFIINDFIALCEELDADGVHVGGTDASVAQVRARLGAGKIVGASCYGDLALARKYGMPLIINNFIELCEELDADAVHLGGTHASVA